MMKYCPMFIPVLYSSSTLIVILEYDICATLAIVIKAIKCKSATLPNIIALFHVRDIKLSTVTSQIRKLKLSFSTNLTPC